jgi:Holliday junction DNA helicase RuvA
MITKMTGTLARVLDDEVRLAVGPFEYQLLVPEAVRRQIQLRTGGEITFHVTEYLDGTPNGNRFVPRRIGFLSELELEFFELFCTVEKIGVKKALKAMARPITEIAGAINRQDARWLSTLPGIGATTAEQVVTTLKRKVTKFLMAPAQPTLVAAVADVPAVVPANEPAKPSGRRKAVAAPEAPALPDPSLVEDVYQALIAVGLNPIDARSKLDGLMSSGKPFKSVEEGLMLAYARG